MSNGLGSVVQEMLGGPPPPHQQITNHSPKSCTLLSPGSVPLPGLANNGNGYSRSIYSPESESASPPVPHHSHLHGHQGAQHSHPPPPPHRPSSLSHGSSGTAANSSSSNKSSSSSNGKSGKRARWLLCYHMRGGGPGNDSPSPPSEHCESQCSTPSPTDHGFKLPNSFSNERPTSLPVALLSGGTITGAGGSGIVAGNGGVAPPLGYSMGESLARIVHVLFL